MNAPRIEAYEFEGHQIGARMDFSKAKLPAAGGHASVESRQHWIFELDGRDFPWTGSPPTMLDLRIRLEEWAHSQIVAMNSRPRGNV